MASISTQFELGDPPTDAISAIRFSPQSTKLLVAAWDRRVYLYELDGSGSAQPIRSFEHRAPVLDVCWGESENEAYSAGLDWDVRRIDLVSGEQTVLSSHSAGVNALAFSSAHHLLISASWDCTLHLHSTNTPGQLPATVPLPHKPFALTASDTRLVVAMAARALHVHDLPALALALSQSGSGEGLNDRNNTLDLEPWQRRESSLKFMTRAVACMPDGAGYASSSIEGRVAVEWFDPSADSQARKYAFKCHRQPAPDAPGTDIVFPVNALAFHPVHGTFASGGGDGTVALWDGLAKRRIRQYQRYPASIAALSFSHDGRWLAVGISPGFEDGKEPMEGEEAGSIKVIIRELSETEAKGKDKQKS